MSMIVFIANVAVTVAAGIVSYRLANRFVRHRLRFVDAVRSPLAPPLAGLAAFLIAWPVAVLLPLVPAVAAAIFGIGTALGTSSAVRALRRGEWDTGRLLP